MTADVWPVTFNQSRVLSRIGLLGAPANIAPPPRIEVTRIEGLLKADVLAEALARVVRRHGALRATFQPSRRIAPTDQAQCSENSP